MRDVYRDRREHGARTSLDGAGVGYVMPQGAFYVMVDVSALGASMDAALTLLESDHVSVVPGAAFGERGEGWARVSLCASDDDLREGLGRVVRRIAS